MNTCVSKYVLTLLECEFSTKCYAYVYSSIINKICVEFYISVTLYFVIYLPSVYAIFRSSPGDDHSGVSIRPYVH